MASVRRYSSPKLLRRRGQSRGNAALTRKVATSILGPVRLHADCVALACDYFREVVAAEAELSQLVRFPPSTGNSGY
jgi:hypothetical protein